MEELKNEIRDAVENELIAANEKYPLFASEHEAYAVMLEEIDEAAAELENIKRFLALAWIQIKKDVTPKALEHFARIKYAAENGAAELCQVAAMAEKAILSAAKRGEDSRGCEYCSGKEVLYQETCNTKLIINTTGAAQALYTEVEHGNDAKTNSAFIINYCPNCGRKL